MADFGLLRIVSDGTNTTSSNSSIQGGSYRWMSPELFDPEKFGLKDGRHTRKSDCYALGMVVYEVLSGRVPFSQLHKYPVIWGIVNGKRPGRPRGEKGTWFTDDIWSILERCWKPNPSDRPGIREVFRYLEKSSGSWTPLPPRTLASPLTMNSPVPGSETSGEESADEGEESSPAETVSSRPSQELSLEGD